MKILIAEDDTVSAKVLQKALERLGHEAVLAETGTQAWQMAQAHHYPMVISDWMMPGMEGPELCRRIRALKSPGYSFFVVLTAKGQKEDRLEAMHAGADDFLSKPVDREELRARLSVAERIITMQEQLQNQNSELDQHRRSLEFSNSQLKQQQGELSTALRSLEATSRIAEVSRNRFSQLFEGLPVACFTYDSNCVIFEWNKRSEEMFGSPPHVAIGKKVQDLLGSDLVDAEAWQTMQIVFRGESFADHEWTSGDRHILVSGLPLYGPDGTITGGIIAAVDVTQQRLAEKQIAKQLLELNDAHAVLAELNGRLEALATTDALTEIPNHRAFQDRLAQFAADASSGRKFALAMVDVDKFKDFNDEFGHQAGDQVLAAVAAALRHGIRQGDFVARYGGEEFCVLFADADEERASQICEDLRRAIEALDSQFRKVTASFGVAGFGEAVTSPAALIKAADDALYIAKDEGRNRVVRFSTRVNGRAA